MLAEVVTRHRIGLDHCRYSPADASGRERQTHLHWMGKRHCWTAETILADSSEVPESEVDWVSKHRMGWIQRCFLFARAVAEARLPIEDRIGSHPTQCRAVRQGWNEEDMATTGISSYHEVVDLGNDEEEKTPSLRPSFPVLWLW